MPFFTLGNRTKRMSRANTTNGTTAPRGALSARGGWGLGSLLQAAPVLLLPTGGVLGGVLAFRGVGRQHERLERGSLEVYDGGVHVSSFG